MQTTLSKPRVLLNSAMRAAHTLLGPTHYERLHFALTQRYLPNLSAPRTFSELILHRKLVRPPSDAEVIADKLAVRSYVSERVGQDHLIPLYWAGDDLATLDWNLLPDRFIAKGTHGSGKEFLFIVQDKSASQELAFREWANRTLQKRYKPSTNEPWYQGIRPRVLIEELLVDRVHGTPPDFKFFVFHGRAHIIQVDTTRFSNHKRAFYDLTWKHVPLRLKYPMATPIERPGNLTKMIEVAERLGSGWDFVRVDLYNTNDDHIYFGELTMSPGAGREKFHPRWYDLDFGRRWRLDSAPAPEPTEHR